MSDTHNPTDTTLPDATHVDAADGDAAVADTLSLAEINQHLGKSFKDKPTALKALKDTFSFVGKKIDAVNPAPAPATDPALEAKVASLEEQVFYSNNPQYKGHENIIKAMGSNPAEVVSGEAFKAYFETAKVAAEVQQKKSVVSSNPRLGQATSHLESAVTAANANRQDTMLEELAKGVREAYEA